ncbi:SET domain-containing protein-lysine N-methyltransferase [Amycolatopsis magusensis]|uniref:SET domain-containing protein-lysine N-methyltransferase n=1 Tax=Amycolatopsis magusensis TaxID=882444 RepID=UPI0035560ACC
MPGKGHGVFAVRRFRPGETVVVGRRVRDLPERTIHSVQTGWNRHVELDRPAVLVNHSCEPNVGIVDNTFDGYDFLALDTIAPGEEITWDNAASEWESIAVPSCLCRSRRCRGASLGYRCLTAAQIAHLGRYTARYLIASPPAPRP